ncbi:hypothetical protein BH11BAC6_BH11BAC6_11330 [soil metagenome]
MPANYSSALFSSIVPLRKRNGTITNYVVCIFAGSQGIVLLYVPKTTAAFILPELHVRDIDGWKDVRVSATTLQEKFIPRLPLYYAQSGEVLLGIQIINTGPIRIYYCRGNVSADFTTYIYSDEAIVVMPILIKGQIKPRPAGEKILALRRGQCCIFSAAKLQLVLDVPLQQNIVLLTILFSTAYFKARVNTMHSGSDLKRMTALNNFYYMMPGAVYMHSGVYDLITRITDAPYSEALHPLYEHICVDIAMVLLQPFKTDHEETANNKSFQDIKKLIDAHKESHYTIEELARTAGINVRQLKEGFRQRFGKGPFAYLKDSRMDYAYGILTDGRKSLKVIAKECGYKHTASFIKSFKKQFGITPGSLRKASKT